MRTSNLHELITDLPNTERIEISGGNTGTEETIAHMRELVTAGKRDPEVVELTGQLISGAGHKDYLDYAKRCFDFCQNNIQYAFDPVGVEMIEDPKVILKNGRADCDSICVLLAAMFECLGFPARFKTIKADMSRPNEYSHVFVEVKIPKQGWVSADATMKKPFGWSPGPEYKSEVWPASFDDVDAYSTDQDAMAGVGAMRESLPYESLIARWNPIEFKLHPIDAPFKTIEENFRSDNQSWEGYKSASPDFFIPMAQDQMHGFRGVAGLEGWSDSSLPYLQGVLDGTLLQKMSKIKVSQQTRGALLQKKMNSVEDKDKQLINDALSLNASAITATDAAMDEISKVYAIMQTRNMGLKNLSADQMLAMGGTDIMNATTALVDSVDKASAAESAASNAQAATKAVSRKVNPFVALGLAFGLVAGGYYIYKHLKK